jgi:hypothetical protein
MGTPEGTPKNIDGNSLDRLPEKKQPGWGVKKPEAPTQQPADPSHELFENSRREQEQNPGVPGVLVGRIRVSRPNWTKQPREQRGEPEALHPNPAELHTKPPSEETVVETLDPEIEEAIREYGLAMGDPEEEARLREAAKQSSLTRESLRHPGRFGLTSSSPDFSFDETPEDKPQS